MNDVNAQVVDWLLETVTWLSRHDLMDELVAAPHGAMPATVEATLAQVHKRRAEELSLVNLGSSGVHTGKLLLLLVDMNLMDAAASSVSDGFYDEFNLPPVATWVALTTLGKTSDKALICWVPEEYVVRAQEGIGVNPEECIGWACELAPDLHHDLAKRVTGCLHLMER